MKLNPTLTIIAIAYLLINGLFYWHATTLNGGASMGYVFIFPVFWVLTIVLITVLSVINRKIWFNKDYRLSTLISLFICTPFFIGLLALLLRPSTYPAVSGFTPENGHTKKFEEWDYNGGKPAIKKYWILDNENNNNNDATGYQKDSTWVYFDKRGDTIKTETYKNDKLIHLKNYK